MSKLQGSIDSMMHSWEGEGTNLTLGIYGTVGFSYMKPLDEKTKQNMTSEEIEDYTKKHKLVKEQLNDFLYNIGASTFPKTVDNIITLTPRTKDAGTEINTYQMHDLLRMDQRNIPGREGFDGTVIFGARDTQSDKYEKASIIIGTRDSGTLAIFLNNGNHIGNIHLSINGLLGGGTGPGIIYNLSSKLENEGIKPEDIDQIILGPMAGNHVELDREYFDTKTQEIKNTYANTSFKIESYITSSNSNNNKVYFRMRDFITELVKFHFTDKVEIQDCKVDTTDLNNNYPSFRSKKGNPNKIATYVETNIGGNNRK